ncbi:MAG: hypothetical protein VB066_01725 [Paludibacter sp.]|nr:hypothetical protein [Paludibacter sp.]
METKKAELKILSKDEQIAVAKDILKRYPEAHKVVVASDGQAFISDRGDAAAKNHSKNNAYGKELKLETFTRDELEAKVELKKAKEVIALIEVAETVEAVEALVAGDERATVKDAAVKRIETLKAA